MKVEIASLLEDSRRTMTHESTWDPSVVEVDNPSCDLERPLEVAFTLRNVEGVIEAEGHYEGRLGFCCSRCLDRYDRPLEGVIEARFYPSDRPLPSVEDEPEDEEEGRRYLAHYRDEAVDLGDVVRQDISLHCPMQPLCRPDCEGLCTVCGQNLNEGDCDHEPTTTDPRLAGLKDLDLPLNDD